MRINTNTAQNVILTHISFDLLLNQIFLNVADTLETTNKSKLFRCLLKCLDYFA